MRRIIGFLVLIAGVGGLGYTATSSNAPRIQAAIATSAQTVAAVSPHGIQAQVSGRDVVVTGRVNDQTELTVLQAGLEGIIGVRVVNVTAVETLPFADPFQLIASHIEDGTITLSGVVPSDADRAVLAGQVGEGVQVLTLAAGVPDVAWTRAVSIGIEALSVLKSGEAVVSGRTLTLNGLARGPVDDTAARAILDDLPIGYSYIPQIKVEDDGMPFEMVMEWDGTVAAMSGKYPSNFTTRGPNAANITDTGRISFLPDAFGAFTKNANLGVVALGLMETGILRATSDVVTLTGTAASPRVGVTIDDLLGSVAPATQIERAITYLDDGSPAAWTLLYSAKDGAVIEGRLPNGLDASLVAQTLGLTVVSGTPAVAFEDPDEGSSLDTLTIAAVYLPEVETLHFSHDSLGSVLDLILSPGVDLDLVAADLAERLPADVAFLLGPLDDLPPEGTTRTSSATGQEEIFTQGFWLPDVDFAVDVQGCGTASDAILADSKITFLSSSARLDAMSIRALSGLAAVAHPCLDAGLMLEIGGHTDATGGAIRNETLSFDRAAAVRIALITRGVSDRFMSSVGYGQTQPIADNATPEGRAANRRTTLTWTALTATPDSAADIAPAVTP